MLCSSHTEYLPFCLISMRPGASGCKISAAMKSASHYALDCKNLYYSIGPHEIRIPSSKLFKPPPNPSGRAATLLAENIACPLCKHVYEYTYGDLRCHSFQIPDQDLTRAEPTCISVEFVCAEPDCKAPVLVHTMRGGTESKKDVIERLRQSVFHVFCPNYHLLHFPLEARSVIRIQETPLHPASS